MDDIAQAGERWPPIGVFALFSFLVPLVANLTTLAAVATKRIRKEEQFEQLTVVDLIVVNICISDGMTSLVYSIGFIWTGANFFNSNAACQFVAFGVTMFAGMSFMFLFVLAYSRYSIVKNSVGFSWRRASILVALVWTAGLAYGTFIVTSGIVDLPPSGLYCVGGYSTQTVLRTINGIAALTLCFGPSVGIFWFYNAITKMVKQNAMDYTLAKKVARMCVVLNTVYFVATAPYGVSIIYSLITGDFLPRVWDEVTSVVVTINFWANPVAYCVYQPKYRNAIFDLLRIRHILKALGYDDVQQKSTKQSSSSHHCKNSRVLSEADNDAPLSHLDSTGGVAMAPLQDETSA